MSSQQPMLSSKNNKSIHLLARLLHHISIPGTIIVAILTTIIAFISSYYWSEKISGSQEYTTMIFGKLNPEVTITIFAVIVLFSIFPVFAGIWVSQLKKPDKSQLVSFSILQVIIISVSDLLIAYFLLRKDSLVIMLLLIISPFLPFEYIINSIKRLYLLKSKTKEFYDLFKQKKFIDLFKQNIKEFALFFSPSFASVIGYTYGLLIIFEFISISSIPHTRGLEYYIITSSAVAAVSIMFYMGSTSGNGPYQSLIIVALMLYIISIGLIHFDVPQNLIMRINDGIIQVPQGLDCALTHASAKKNGTKTSPVTQCAYKTMYTLKLPNKVLFSCKTKNNGYIYGAILSGENNTLYDLIAKNPNKQFIYNFNCIEHKKDFICQKYITLSDPKKANKSKSSTLPQPTNAHTDS